MWGEEHGVECMSSCPSVVLGPLLATPHDMTWQHRLCEMFAGKYLFRGICLHNKTPQFATRVRCCLLCIYMPAIDRSLSLCCLLCIYMPAIDRSLSLIAGTV